MVQLIGVAFVRYFVKALALTVVGFIPVVDRATALLTVVGVTVVMLAAQAGWMRVIRRRTRL